MANNLLPSISSFRLSRSLRVIFTDCKSRFLKEPFLLLFLQIEHYQQPLAFKGTLRKASTSIRGFKTVQLE